MKKNYIIQCMKISLVQVMLAIGCASISMARNANAQELLNRKVSIQVNDEKLKNVLSQIEKSANVSFFYSPQSIKASQKVTLVSYNEAVSSLLERLLTPLNIIYQVNGSQIVLKQKELTIRPLDLKKTDENTNSLHSMMLLQPVTGTVTNEKNEALPGVSILVKGTQQGTTTNINGQFKLEVPSANSVLVFSFIGYLPQEVQVGSKTTINIVMIENAASLDEIVVVGYGSQIKRDLTGSIQSINTAELKDLPVAQLTQKLQGRLAGVQINNISGKPGQGMSVRIRGQASILASSEPLYVVDGFPIVGDINTINPDEIENISVLKDAASTSLYGSRAANGVVLITTKQSKKGQTNIGFNYFTGWQEVPQKGRPPIMNAQEFATFKKESFEDLGQPVPAAFQNPAQYANNDWYGAMFRVAPMNSYNLTLTSNKDRLSTSVVAGVFQQDGVMINSRFDRYSVRLNADYVVSDKIKVGLNVAPTYAINTTPSSDGAFYATNLNAALPGGLISNAMLTWPTLPFKNADGSLPLSIPGGTFPTPNWYRAAQEIKNETKTTRLLSNAYLQYEPIKSLVLKATFNVDLGNAEFKNFNPSTASTVFASLPPTIASAVNNDTKYLSWLNENTLTYTKSINQHNFEFLAGYTSQKFIQNIDQIRATNFPDDRIQAIQSALNIDRVNTFSNIQEWSLLSYLSRLNYSFKGKYLVSAAIRRDGSSRFGANNRWGNFPSLGVGWVMSEEEFLKKVNLVSFAKIRASYGVIGNNNIGNYTQYALINNTANAVFGNAIVSGAAVTTLGNSNLGWETTKQLDLGFDLGILNDRISITYDYYLKNTTNLLYNVAVPQESGFTNFNDNVGEIKFWGHEVALNTKNLVNTLKWSTNLNLSFNRNEVVALADGVARIYGGPNNYNTITMPGYPIGQFWGLVHEGVYKNADEFNKSPKAIDSQIGTAKYRDVNGDGRITIGGDNDDRTIIGNPFPNVLVGLTNTFNYKNFDLSIVGSGSFGNDLMVMYEQGLTNLDGVFNVLKDVKDRWRSESNPGAGKYGKTTGATYMERDWGSTRFVSKGDFFTIKNVTLGYNIPAKTKYIRSARVYASVQQALVITKYRGTNPETSTANNGTPGTTLNLGMDWGSYPIPRTFTIGLNVGF